MSMTPRSNLRCLMMASALALGACGDDTSPADDGSDDTTGASSTTNGGITLTTTLSTSTTMGEDTTTGLDTTDDGDTTLDDTTTTDDTTTSLDDSTTNDTTGDSTGTTGDESTGTTGGEVACSEPEDCPVPRNECLTRTCENDECGTAPVASGTPTSTQTVGNCVEMQCDGSGNAVEVNDDTDLPNDGNDCTFDLCDDGTPLHPPVDGGEACSTNGGQVCNVTGTCVECINDAQCNGGTCTNEVCAPNVIAVDPTDEAADVAVDDPISLTFSHAMDPVTLTAQTDAGACTGSIQVSYNNFASCIGFASAAPTMSSGDTVATLTPSPDLAHGVTYAVRVTTAAESATGLALAAQHESTFTTVAPSLCAGTVVISQVYGAGGNSGAVLTNDYMELHNTGTTPVTLNGWSLQYAATEGSSWGVTQLQGVIPAGGYYLVQQSGGANGDPLPTPDQAGSIAMAAAAGKVALVSSHITLSGTCPDTNIVDFVGYGAGTNCFEGSGPTAGISPTTAAHRDVSGCFDANDNATDFAIGAPMPRNSASAAGYCSCSLDEIMNETGDDDEVDYCNLQHPASLIVDELVMTEVVYGRLYEAGITDQGAVEPAGVLAQLGYGRAATTLDDLNSEWVWFDATYNVHAGDDAEYMTSFRAPAVQAASDYAYTYRFSLDEGYTWTYCDLDGAGSNDDLAFDVDQVGPMTVNP